MPQSPELTYLELPDGRHVATRLRAGRDPTFLFLPGYASDMEGGKAVALDGFAAERGVGLLRLDYSGTGSSSGAFEEGTLERWTEEALAAVGQLTEGPLILVGSSMGGWIALHLGLALPDRVQGLIGIAAAPDFTEWGYSDGDKRTLVETGRLEQPNPYADEPHLTTRSLWESGERMKLLDRVIPIDCPVRLIHGEADAEVPVSIALKLAARLRSADVQTTLVKGGGHRLSEPHQIRTILRAADDLLELAR